MGLVYIDGHSDFYRPSQSPTGEVADMVLSIVTGNDCETLSNIEGREPYFAEERSVLFGFRDSLESKRDGVSFGDSRVKRYTLNRLRKGRFTQHVKEATGIAGGRGYWVHLDVDVLSPVEMPAVDYLQPQGLSFIELETALKIFVSDQQFFGLDITIYNPNLDDKNKTAGKNIVKLLKSVL